MANDLTGEVFVSREAFTNRLFYILPREPRVSGREKGLTALLLKWQKRKLLSKSDNSKYDSFRIVGNSAKGTN